MKTRIKKAAAMVILTRLDAEAMVNEVTLAQINRRKLEAQMDAHLADCKARYGVLFAEIDAKTDPAVEALKNWAQAHPKEFKGAKSIQFATGTIGFRTGMPKLKLLKKLTWDLLLDRVKRLGLKRYIRVIEEVNKEAMIADREGAEHGLRDLGVEVVQAEMFYVEPLDSAETGARNAELKKEA